jgi:UDP-glucose 4-epimerase
MTDLPQVIVTGGAGFIGSHLVERLLAEGRRVTVIDDFSTGRLENLQAVSAHPNLQVRRCRVSDCLDLAELVAGAEAVFHLAAAVGVELVVKSPIRTIQTNLRETEAVLQAVSSSRTLLLLTSTSEVYGKSQKDAFREDDDLLIGPPHLGRWSYACSKLMDEFMAMAYARERGLPVIIARLFNTAGLRQTGRYGMVLPRFVAAAKAGRSLRVYGDGTQTRCFCDVLDTIEALVRLQRCSEAQGQVFNVGSTEEVSIYDLAKLVKEIVGSSSGLELVPYNEAYAPGFEDMLRRKPNVEKLFKFVRFRPQTRLRRLIERVVSV